MNNREENPKYRQQIHIPRYMKIIMLLVVFSVLLSVLWLTLYRYSLVGNAFNKKDYTTALALTSPEIGTGLSLLSVALI